MPTFDMRRVSPQDALRDAAVGARERHRGGAGRWAMKRLSQLCVWLFLMGMIPGAWAAAPEEIAKLREQFTQAFNAGDVEAISALLTDDTQFFSALQPFRVDGKEAVRAAWAGLFHNFPTRTLIFRQPSTRVYGETAAVDNGYFHAILVDAKGQATTVLGRYSTTYVKQGGKWGVVNLHGSRLPVSP